MYIERLLSLSTLLVLGLCPLFGQSNPDVTLGVTVTGTIGAVLSGIDPLGTSGEAGTVKVVLSESLSPTKTTATSATYTLPAGAVTVILGTTSYSTTTPASMKITLPASGPDVVALTANVQAANFLVTVVGIIDLKHGSFPASILTHPAPFTPSPQRVTSATSTTGTGSKIQYTIQGEVTVLGFSGSAGNKASQDPMLPADDTDQ
jgi:hypothetical protein